MSGKFITNHDETLKEIIDLTLPKTEYMKFLVGYFYFSGFREFYKNIGDKPMTVIVGMDVEVDITNYITEGYRSLKGLNNEQIKEHQIENMKDWFNNDSTTDTYEYDEAIRLFINKIKNNTLNIYRTKEPNHSKVYIFKYTADEAARQGRDYGTMILGSSNFTKSGMSGRYEFNAEFTDTDDVKKGEALFDELLKNGAIKITEGGKDDPVVQMFEKKTRIAVPSPYYCYLKVLSEYFSTEKNVDDIVMPSKITENSSKRFSDFSYQVHAIQDALDMIEIHNGVLIADVVGMGKSIIGATLLHNLNQKSIIVCKPHLISMWEGYVKNFGLNAGMSTKVMSSGNLKKVVEELEQETNPKYRTKVVMIDEVHKFRNGFNKDYALLQKICQGKKLILLTATPFNNQPDDVFNLIKLFQIPKKPTILTMKSLNHEFQELQKMYIKMKDVIRGKAKNKEDKKLTPEDGKKKLKEISETIRELIRPVTIRRSRKDLESRKDYMQDLQKQGFTKFSKIQPPKNLDFELGDIEQDYIVTLDDLLERYEGLIGGNIKKLKERKFKCARYTALAYVKKEVKEKYEEEFEKAHGYKYKFLEGRQQNMPLFITRQLISRFESSINGFMISLDNIIRNYEQYIKYIESKKKIPVISAGKLSKLIDMSSEVNSEKEDEDRYELEEDQEETQEENVLGNVDKKEEEYMDKAGGMFIKIEDIEGDFIEHLKSDLRFLKEIYKRWNDIYGEKFNKTQDNKYEALKNLIKEKMSDRGLEGEQRKVVVFSQYEATVQYLTRKLEQDFDQRVLRVSGSNKDTGIIKEIEENFDATAKDQKDKYDIIVATDSISEGFNLHRAGLIVNYDIPWNPTVIIQRVGRINRIDKTVFEKLYIYNAFPSLVGKQIHQVEDVAKIKNQMINTILGSDTKILDENEDLGSFYDRLIKEDEEQEDKDPIQEFRKIYDDLILSNPEELEKAKEIPIKSKVGRKDKKIGSKKYKGMVVFGKKGNQCIFKYYDMLSDEEKKIKNINIIDGMKFFESIKDEKALPITPKSYQEIYPKITKGLFTSDLASDTDTKSRNAIVNLQTYKKDFDQDYYEKITYCINSLGTLSPRHLRMIRNITESNKKDKIKELMNELTLSDLEKMKQIAEGIDDQDKTIILAEEFI